MITAGGGAAASSGVAGDWPPVQSEAAARLRTAWYRRSLQGSWTSAPDWWHPACDALIEALVANRDVRPAARRLGQARARLGSTVEETTDDVLALWDQHAHADPPARVLQAVAAGWAEAALDLTGAASCFDPVTGLFTRAYLEARLGELYRTGALGGPALAHQLVVLDLGLPPGEGPGLSGWRQVAGLYRCAEAVRRTFAGGETLTRLAPARIAALASSGPGLSRKLAGLEALLAAGAEPGVVPAMWVESLPRTFGLVPGLLADLSR